MEPLSPVSDGVVVPIRRTQAALASRPLVEAGSFDHDDDDFPATPPAEVLDALDRAARVLGDLDRRNINVSLHQDSGQQMRVTASRPGSGSRDLSVDGLLNLLDGDMSEVT
jgi:hypothetical protein